MDTTSLRPLSRTLSYVGTGLAPLFAVAAFVFVFMEVLWGIDGGTVWGVSFVPIAVLFALVGMCARLLHQAAQRIERLEAHVSGRPRGGDEDR